MKAGSKKIKQAFEQNQKLIKDKKYLLLFKSVKDLILNGDIPNQMLMPPTRNLAEHLGVSRSTVLKAYELLKLESLVSSVQGSGYRISSPEQKRINTVHRSPENYPTLSDAGKRFYSNINLINSTEDESIAFRPGLPPLDIFPVNQWKKLSNNYWKHISLSSLSYSATSGINALKHNIADYLSVMRGIKCAPEQIFVVSGSLQSLYLISRVLINPGDLAVVENPTFPNVHSILKSMSAELVPLDLDDEGISLNDFQPKKNDQIKLIHVTPSCHYPSGNLMSMNRKHEVLRWARDQKCIVVENDYEHELNNWEKSSPAIFSLDEEQRTIYLGTFNRLLHPSLRIGYMVVPLFLKDILDGLMRHSHRFVSPSIQVVLNQFIEKQYLYQHVGRLVDVVAERKEVFTREFNKVFEGRLELIEPEVPGLQLVARTPETTTDRELADKLNAHRIIAHAHSKCFVGEPKANGLIFGHASVRTPVIRNRIGHMARHI